MPSQANQPLPEGYPLEGYRIAGVLSCGGFSIVYLAYDENDQPVAIKEYLPAQLALRQQGDVLISWESEAHLLLKEFGSKVEWVYPSLSILAEPPVTLVDKNVDRKGTRAVAQAYLDYLYSDVGQHIVAKHFYRPANEKIAAQYASKLPHIPLFTIDQAFGNWAKANQTHFADGGVFDQIYTRR